MKRYKVPDHFRRGLRQAIGVGIAVYVGYLLLHGAAVPLHCFSCLLPQTWQQGTFAPCGQTRALLRPGVTGVDEQHARQWLQGAKWAAITIVVVGSPVLGKVTQARCRRALHWSSSSVKLPHSVTAFFLGAGTRTSFCQHTPVKRLRKGVSAGVGGAHARHGHRRPHWPGRGAAGRLPGALSQPDGHCIHQCAWQPLRCPGRHRTGCSNAG